MYYILIIITNHNLPFYTENDTICLTLNVSQSTTLQSYCQTTPTFYMFSFMYLSRRFIFFAHCIVGEYLVSMHLTVFSIPADYNPNENTAFEPSYNQYVPWNWDMARGCLK